VDSYATVVKTVRMSNHLQKLSAQYVFAANVRRIRLEKQLTQEVLAEGAGLHPNYISSVERGERNISIGNIERIATALEVNITELLTPYSKEI
jgi:transcriptional regulator with XRE-family HTH domain